LEESTMIKRGIGFAIAAFGALALAPFAATQTPANVVETEIVGADGAKMSGNTANGADVFKKCQQCHTLEPGKNKVGPTLHGIIGRTAGTVEGYNYSTANKNSGIVWTEQKMFEYLENPRKTIPGTKMAFVGLPKIQDRVDVIAYIQESGKPAPAAP
jgi:cytochrome c